MNDLRFASYRLRTAVERLGRVGGLGIALLFGCAVFFVTAVRPVEDEFAGLQEQRVAEELAQRTGRPVLDDAAQLAQFVAFFPDADSTAEWLARLYAAAEQERLVLAQGTYKRRGDSELGLIAYQVTLPVRGTYGEVRRFIAQVLADVPAAALESVQFQRERSADGAIDARIVLVLHLRETSGTRPAVPRDDDVLRQEADAGEDVLARAEVRR